MKKILTLMLAAAALAGFADAALDRMKPYAVDRIVVADGEKGREAVALKSHIAPGRSGVAARSAGRGGNFSYCLKVADAALPQLLHVRYSGDERPKPGEKLLFRISVDGKQLAVQGINRNFPNSFIDEYYPLPPELLKGKDTVTVHFEPYDAKCSVAGVYVVSILRDKTGYGRFDRLADYKGIRRRAGDAAYFMPVPGEITFTEPDGPRGWYRQGWQTLGDGVYDMTQNYGLELEVDLRGTDRATVEFIAGISTLPKEDRDTGDISRTVRFELGRGGKQTILLPFMDFANPSANISDVMYKLKHLTIRTAGSGGELAIDSIRVLKGYRVALETECWSKPAGTDGLAVYNLKVTNTGKERSGFSLRQLRRNWEAMETAVEPARLILGPDESATVKVTVRVPGKIPPGGNERQVILVTPDGDSAAAARAEFITLAPMPAPYLIHDRKGWDEVRAKAKKYDWAKKRLEKYEKSAAAWQVPEVEVYKTSSDTKRPYLVAMQQEVNLMDAAVAYILTGNREYAGKVALFLRRISDPAAGFPKTRQVGHQSEVQEGHMFQHLAQAYDLIRDAGVLSSEDVRNIETTFRLYCDMILRNNRHPAGANWALSTETGAFFCALALQDLKLAGEFVHGPGMILDKLRSYTMSDGWWYECSISYNLWCAEEFVQVALAFERFGYSMLNDRYRVNYGSAPDYLLDDRTERDQRINVHYGHSFRIFGGIGENSVTIRKMFDAMVPYIDYRGWIFGINDSYENNVGGGRFELAYYAFRDPYYASFIKRAPERDNLIYGVPELPEETPETGKGSAYSDNVGLLMLRSTQEEPRERIQAVLKYGTHGGYHGHYDRTGLLSMMRYGRSFFNPEMIWYSYQPFMYNFYVQSSIAKNMVTVDLKQQAVDDSRRLLFRTGAMLQAGAVETTAEWSNPGYGGLRWGHIGYPTFSSKAESEGRFVPVPDPEPRYGSMSGFTEPILQRRLLGVTDDYIVIADYVQGSRPHDFDQLFQVKGLLDVSAPELKLTERLPQLDPDPLKSAQFVTDVKQYEAAGTLKMSFLTKFGPGADNRGTRINGEDGNLFMNLYCAWPRERRTAFTGIAPENHNVARRLAWSVRGDGRTLAGGKFGAWILGDARIDVPLDGVETLELSTAVEKRAGIHTLFWADAVIETKDGGTIRLNDLEPVSSENIVRNKFRPEQDYEGGKINIAGKDYRFGLPADPDKSGENRPAVYRFDLSKLNAKRLRAVVGGDYPVGNEAERRITAGVRSTGTSAVFLTVMEPFEKDGAIASVEAKSADELEVRLKDGRLHRFELKGLTGDGSGVGLVLKEYDGSGRLLREE